MTKIAILGANGRLGRVVGKAFIDAGFDVRAVTRTGKVPAELKGATAVVGDALDREQLIRATQGVDIIFNGLNPLYTDWGKCVPMARERHGGVPRQRHAASLPRHRLQLRVADA
jgi:uncharacterized protein YbjT (DUF2867 family)